MISHMILYSTYYLIANYKYKSKYVQSNSLIIKARWIPGGHETYGAYANSVVHIVMYSYYMFAAMGVPQKYLW